jgi:hypothetical protein
MSKPATDRQRQYFVLFLVALLPAGNAMNPCLDVDSWWHLRVGQNIVPQTRLPDREQFSQLGQREQVPWIAYSWLYELLLYGCFEAGGFAGVLILRHALDLMTFCGIAWCLLRHARSTWVALGVLSLVTVSLLPFMPERPWHFTIFFSTLTLHAVLRIREGVAARRFAWLPLAYVLWANIHIQFVMGFALLGLGWAATVVEWRRSGDPARRKQAIGLFFLGAACTLATFCTPYHWRLYVVIWEYASQTAVLSLVSELQAPDLLKWWNLPLIAVLIGAAASVSLRGYRLWDLIMLASALFFSLRMQRDLWYGVLISGTIIVRSTGREEGNDRGLSAARIVAISALALLLMQVLWEAGLSRGKTFETCHAETFPVAAVEHVRQAGLSGPLFNNFDWGGYLIWALPEMPVSVDGRTNLYGEARLNRSINTWQGRDPKGNVNDEWQNDPDLRGANVIVAPSNRIEKTKLIASGQPETEIDIYALKSPLTELLLKSPHWKKEFEDETAIVFVAVKAR